MNNAPLPEAIGKYHVLRELGRGASSIVYLAEDPFRARKVALKRIHPHLLRDERDGAQYRRAFRNEARLAGKLRHPYIVAVHDADPQALPPYLVLEYIEGAQLGVFSTPDRLLPVEQVLDICFKCCSAMEYAHQHGLVHRDIKPANLILQGNGDVKVADFGTALTTTGDQTQITGLVGSPLYMAPEQVREEPCTHRSDMFSLGVVAYELLTGRRPFEGGSDYATLYKIGNEEPPLPTLLRPTLPAAVDEVLARAMAKRPDDRFAEWRDFADALLAINRSIPRRETRHREGDAFAQMRKLPFFAGFPDAALWETIRLGKLSSHPADEVLMEEGAEGLSFLVLLEGRVTVRHGGVQVATLEPGVTIGEMAYLRRDEPRRTATVTAQTAVLTLEIRSDALRQASEDLQGCFDKSFIELLMQRLIATTDELRRQSANVFTLA